ncbi:hypothetical protein N9948_00035 [bacterium]|nr:hypothetical protein [bacterium]
MSMISVKEVLSLDSIPKVKEQLAIRTKLSNEMVGQLYRGIISDEILAVVKHLQLLENKEKSVRFILTNG